MHAIRGVATYMTPIFALAAILPAAGVAWQVGFKRRWQHGLAFLIGAFVVVAPYTIQASHKQGGFIVSDATLNSRINSARPWLSGTSTAT